MAKNVKNQILDSLKWFKAKLTSSIVNNCSSTSTTLPLSAAQGRSLQNQITQQNTNIIKSPSIILQTGEKTGWKSVNTSCSLADAHWLIISVSNTTWAVVNSYFMHIDWFKQTNAVRPAILQRTSDADMVAVCWASNTTIQFYNMGGMIIQVWKVL